MFEDLRYSLPVSSRSPSFTLVAVVGLALGNWCEQRHFHRNERGSASPSSLYGRGRSRTAFITVKMALFAPIPKAKPTTATKVKLGLLASTRRL